MRWYPIILSNSIYPKNSINNLSINTTLTWIVYHKISKSHLSLWKYNDDSSSYIHFTLIKKFKTFRWKKIMWVFSSVFLANIISNSVFMKNEDLKIQRWNII